MRSNKSYAAFPLIKLAKKLKDFDALALLGPKVLFPLIKLAKKLKVVMPDTVGTGGDSHVSIN